VKKLYTFNLSERALAGMFREFLRKEGIECVIRNEGLFAALGEIPFTECYPELWVVDNELYPRASNLLRQWMEKASERPPWSCPDCGEQIEGQFCACWKCGHGQERD
jgi:hypothetical protein